MHHHKSDQTKIKSQKPVGTEKPKRFERRKPRAPKKITKQYLHNAGLYYLERFAASKSHFKFVMMRKVKRSCNHHIDQDLESCRELVDQLADKFEDVGLLNDDVYARGLITSLRRRGKSKSAITNKMREKGIHKEKTLQVLETLDNEQYHDQEEAEKSAALKLARKKKIGPYYVGEEQDMKKSLGVLARAGFSYATAQFILDLDEEELDELPIQMF